MQKCTYDVTFRACVSEQMDQTQHLAGLTASGTSLTRPWFPPHTFLSPYGDRTPSWRGLSYKIRTVCTYWLLRDWHFLGGGRNDDSEDKSNQLLLFQSLASSIHFWQFTMTFNSSSKASVSLSCPPPHPQLCLHKDVPRSHYFKYEWMNKQHLIFIRK